MFDTATLLKLNDLRGRVMRGEHVDDAELAAALVILSEGRAVMSAASAEKKAKTKSIVVPSGASLLEMMAANMKKKAEAGSVS